MQLFTSLLLLPIRLQQIYLLIYPTEATIKRPMLVHMTKMSLFGSPCVKTWLKNNLGDVRQLEENKHYCRIWN